MKFMVLPPLIAKVAQLSWPEWTEREARTGGNTYPQIL